MFIAQLITIVFINTKYYSRSPHLTTTPLYDHLVITYSHILSTPN